MWDVRNTATFSPGILQHLRVNCDFISSSESNSKLVGLFFDETAQRRHRERDQRLGFETKETTLQMQWTVQQNNDMRKFSPAYVLLGCAKKLEVPKTGFVVFFDPTIWIGDLFDCIGFYFLRNLLRYEKTCVINQQEKFKKNVVKVFTEAPYYIVTLYPMWRPTIPDRYERIRTYLHAHTYDPLTPTKPTCLHTNPTKSTIPANTTLYNSYNPIYPTLLYPTCLWGGYNQ